MISARRIGNKKSSTKKAIMIHIKFKILKLITENSAVIIFLGCAYLSALLITYEILSSLAIVLGFPSFLEISSSDIPSCLPLIK